MANPNSYKGLLEEIKQERIRIDAHLHSAGERSRQLIRDLFSGLEDRVKEELAAHSERIDELLHQTLSAFNGTVEAYKEDIAAHVERQYGGMILNLNDRVRSLEDKVFALQFDRKRSWWRKMMNRIFMAVAIVLTLAGGALASPFLVCDPQAGVEWYEITGMPAPMDGSYVQAQTDGSIKFDLAQCPVGGPYSIQVKACAVWGCSNSSPFAFTRPASLASPTHIKLSK